MKLLLLLMFCLGIGLVIYGNKKPRTDNLFVLNRPVEDVYFPQPVLDPPTAIESPSSLPNSLPWKMSKWTPIVGIALSTTAVILSLKGGK